MKFSGKEKEVLNLLALKGQKTRYDLFKRKGGIMASSTAHTCLEGLRRKKLIALKMDEQSETTKRKRKPYRLTLKGLFIVLSELDRMNSLSRIADQQKELLPLILGKWQHYKDYKLTAEHLKKALDFLCRTKEKVLKPKEIMRDFAFFIFTKTSPEERISWLKALHDDVDLQLWLLGEEEFFKKWATTLEISFELIREPDPHWDIILEDLQQSSWSPP